MFQVAIRFVSESGKERVVKIGRVYETRSAAQDLADLCIKTDMSHLAKSAKETLDAAWVAEVGK